jgi:hypothetical protein
MTFDQNPFDDADPDQREIWDMLLRRDIEAFVAVDWTRHAQDFLREEFVGIDAAGSLSPGDWHLRFPSLDEYAAQWLGFSRRSAAVEWAEDLRLAHFRVSRLQRMRQDGSNESLDWQTVYLCARRHGRWWIRGFVGYLPA